MSFVWGDSRPGPAGAQLEDPAFLAWARAQGKPVNRSTPASELAELLAEYAELLAEHEYVRREQERERKRRQEEGDRRAVDRAKAVWLSRDSGSRALVAGRDAGEDEALRSRISAAWKRFDRADLRTNARYHVSKAIPILDYLHSGHLAAETDRWLYMRYYYLALSAAFDAGTPSERQLLDNAVLEEKKYLAELERRAAELARARGPALQLEALKAWARRQPMNPADNFEPGIAYYDLDFATSKPDWVDRDLKDISQDNYTTTLSYTRGRSLSFPSKSLDFERKYQGSILEIFARRHKASGRLVPFVLYAPNVDLYVDLPAVDALSSKDLVLMALPNMLTAAVLEFYLRDPFLEIADGLLNVLQLMSLQKGLVMAAPKAPVVVGAAAQVGTRAVAFGQSTVALTARAGAQVRYAVTTYGYSVQAAVHIGRSAYTYYLVNAVAVNTAALIGADIAVSVAGQDMGPMSPGDQVTMAAEIDDVLSGMAKTWKAVRGEVVQVDAAGALIRVKSADTIADDVAKAEYDLGKIIKSETQGASSTARSVDDPAIKARAIQTPDPPGAPRSPIVPPGKVPRGKGKLKLAPDPRSAVPISELEDAMKKVATGLDRLTAKYDAQALEKIRNLSADAIRESGIRPSDLAKLANSLARAGPTTRKFINDFHNVPGFDRVLLGWRKRHYWNTRLKKPAWTATKAFYTGSSYAMKYATKRLDPKFVRFEWPASITDTAWGDEVFARYVDIVVTGGTMMKPGQHIQIELKSWTEYVLAMKTRFPPGKATSYPGSVGYQLLRDTALFHPDNIRWVFDGSKVTKSNVIEAFKKIIADDDFLRAEWGGKDGDPATIRALLDKVIDVF